MGWFSTDDLSADEATEFTERLIEASAVNVPLVSGLRATAIEITNHRVRAALQQLANSIDHGKSLEEGLDSSQLKIPAFLAGLLQSAVRAGALPEVLADLTDHYRTSQHQWRQIWLALMYPCTLLLLLFVLICFVLFSVVPGVTEIFGEFEVEVPPMTASVIWASTTGWKFGLAAIIFLFIISLLIRFVGGPGSWTRVVSWLPGIGSLFHWHGFADFSHLLRLLLLQEVPLPEALRLTSGAIRNANVAQTTRSLSDQVAAGLMLSEAMLRDEQVPAHVIPAIRMGEEHDRLPESLSVVSDLLAGQIQLRSQLLIMVLPPIVFLIVAGCSVALLLSLFLPLIDIFSALGI